MSAPALRLHPFDFWFVPQEGPLLPQLRQALLQSAEQRLGPGAEPLRWAITAVEPQQGVRLEGVLVGPER